MCTQKLNRHQTDQTKPSHHDCLAERRLHKTDALKGDRAEYCKCRLVIGDPFWNPRAQVHRHADHLGVLTVGHHSVPDLKVGDATSRDHDPSDVAVTEGQRLIQLVHDRLKRRQKPICFDFVEHHPNLVRLLAGLCDPTGLSKFHEHALGADRDECP